MFASEAERVPLRRLRWTSHDLELLPDDGSRYEIVDGELYVTKPLHWEHQFVCGQIFALLQTWSNQTQLGMANLSPGGDNERRDREVKLKLYSRRNVKEYWVVNWRERSLEIYRRQEGVLSLIELWARMTPSGHQHCQGSVAKLVSFLLAFFR